MKDAPRESFRWAAHTSGRAVVKPKDFESDQSIESPNPYAAWKTLLGEGRPLRPGDLLETIATDDFPHGTPAEIRIAKYIGFEMAEWFVAETKPAAPGNALPSSEIPAQSEEHVAP